MTGVAGVRPGRKDRAKRHASGAKREKEKGTLLNGIKLSSNSLFYQLLT